MTIPLREGAGIKRAVAPGAAAVRAAACRALLGGRMVRTALADTVTLRR